MLIVLLVTGCNTCRCCCISCRSPSALPALQEVLQGAAPPKLLLVGARLNSDCIPRRSNYSAFATAAAAAARSRSGGESAVQPTGAGVVADANSPGSMLVVLQQTGHLQFLDTQTTLQRWVLCSCHIVAYSLAM